MDVTNCDFLFNLLLRGGERQFFDAYEQTDTEILRVSKTYQKVTYDAAYKLYKEKTQ